MQKLKHLTLYQASEDFVKKKYTTFYSNQRQQTASLNTRSEVWVVPTQEAMGTLILVSFLLRVLCSPPDSYVCVKKHLEIINILIVFTLKNDFFTLYKVFKKVRIVFVTLLSKVVSAHDTLPH